jgi:methionyl-tRNA formyltransferase
MSAVKQLALAHHLSVAEPRSLRLDGPYPADAQAARAAIEAAQADAMVVAAYGLILPPWLLELMQAAPRHGCFNIHASLLPRWRGAAPIHRAIEAGDSQTGVTIMQMDAGLDSGDMLLQEALPIHATDTTASLHDRLAELGAQLLLQTLALASQHRLTPRRQDAAAATYAHKVNKSEAALDWSQSAEVLARRVRAFNPFPVAHATLRGETLKVWQAHAAASKTSAPPGCVLAASAQGVAVATGQGALVLTELQRAGGKRLALADFLRGFQVTPAMRFAPAQPGQD